MSAEVELKPCPFCGSTEIDNHPVSIDKNYHKTQFEIRSVCRNCDAIGPMVCNIDWNARPQPSETKGVDIKWPEKKKCDRNCYNDEHIKDCGCDQWNAAIDACKQAYAKSSPALVGLDEEKLLEIFKDKHIRRTEEGSLSSEYKGTIIRHLYSLSPESFVNIILKTFGSPAKRMPTEKEILDSWNIVGSTYHPILNINGKLYHFMCKEELAKKVINLLTQEEGKT